MLYNNSIEIIVLCVVTAVDPSTASSLLISSHLFYTCNGVYVHKCKKYFICEDKNIYMWRMDEILSIEAFTKNLAQNQFFIQ